MVVESGCITPGMSANRLVAQLHLTEMQMAFQQYSL